MTITLFILIITVVVSVISFSRQNYLSKLEYSPYMTYHFNQWYRMLSHALVHTDWMHLTVNMYVLYQFGKITEAFYSMYFGAQGIVYFIFLYIGGVLFAALPALRKQRDQPHYSAVGASGAVSAVLFASIMFIPMESLRLFFIPIDIPAFVFGILYLVFEAYMNKKGGDNIAHDAHIWGAIFGLVFTCVLDYTILLSFFDQLFK